MEGGSEGEEEEEVGDPPVSKEANQKGEKRNGDEGEKRRRVHFHEKLNYAWQREKKERSRDGWRGAGGPTYAEDCEEGYRGEGKGDYKNKKNFLKR